MKPGARFAVALVLAIAFPVSFARAELINPSFETGDLTGWLAGKRLAIAWPESTSGASDGVYCFSATYDPQGIIVVPGTGAEPWSVRLTQWFALPTWVTALSIDVRSGEECAAAATLSEMGATGPTGTIIDILAGVASPAPSGFTRYTVEVSALAGCDVRLDIELSGIFGNPATISVDNVVLIPEPTALALLVFGGLAIFGRRRRSG